MRGLQSILSFFRGKFNKLNDTGAQMIDSIYHMTQTSVKSCFLLSENVQILTYIYGTLEWPS